MTKHLLTSALPYVNGHKHLGNLAGSLLPADVHARFLRQCGEDVLFVCGTDEHGTPAELAAAREGLSPRAYCDLWHARQKAAYEGFDLSFDRFGRTSSAANRELTVRLFELLDRRGLIEDREIEQVWSPSDGRFLPDRYVLGTCPRCGHADARGDQCDACGYLLDPADLVDPRSALSGKGGLERRPSRHLFLRQDLLVPRLREWIEARDGWPPFAKSLALSLLTDDLRPRCITRDLSWGIPVPRPGFEDKVFYVWFDAPIGYLAAVAEWASEDRTRGSWLDWWQGDDVRLVQFLGKDNVPFHTVSFPATLLGSGEPWKTADVIKAFHWLTYEGGKFSSSQGRGIFVDRAPDILPVDGWRWWLVANSPETGDVDLDLSRVIPEVDKDLCGNLGNLAYRLSSLRSKLPPAIVPAPPTDAEREAEAKAGTLIATVAEAHRDLAFRKAASATRALWSHANAYLQAAEPWRHVAADAASAARGVGCALGLLEACAAAAWPITPRLSERILGGFGPGKARPGWPSDPRTCALGTLPPYLLEAPPFPRPDVSSVDRIRRDLGGRRKE